MNRKRKAVIGIEPLGIICITPGLGVGAPFFLSASLSLCFSALITSQTTENQPKTITAQGGTPRNFRGMSHGNSAVIR